MKRVKINSKVAILIAMFAITLTLSCSGGDDNSGGNPNNNSSSSNNIDNNKCGGYYWSNYADAGLVRCQNGVVEYKCPPDDGIWYNSETHGCIVIDLKFTLVTKEQSIEYSEQLGYSRCGNKNVYYPGHSYQRCRDGVAEFEYNGTWYDSEKYFCVTGREGCLSQLFELVRCCI
jgi:hypothetical protein